VANLQTLFYDIQLESPELQNNLKPKPHGVAEGAAGSICVKAIARPVSAPAPSSTRPAEQHVGPERRRPFRRIGHRFSYSKDNDLMRFLIDVVEFCWHNLDLNGLQVLRILAALVDSRQKSIPHLCVSFFVQQQQIDSACCAVSNEKWDNSYHDAQIELQQSRCFRVSPDSPIIISTATFNSFLHFLPHVDFLNNGAADKWQLCLQLQAGGSDRINDLDQDTALSEMWLKLERRTSKAPSYFMVNTKISLSVCTFSGIPCVSPALSVVLHLYEQRADTSGVTIVTAVVISIVTFVMTGVSHIGVSLCTGAGLQMVMHVALVVALIARFLVPQGAHRLRPRFLVASRLPRRAVHLFTMLLALTQGARGDMHHISSDTRESGELPEPEPEPDRYRYR
jgi:hypothetical protein